MTDLRLYQQGQELPLILHTGTWPDATPTATLASVAGAAAVTVPLPADDQAVGPGLFRLGWPLDGRTTPGDYLVVYRWLAGGVPRMNVQRVRVIPGGGPDGAVVAMYAAARPARTAVLMQSDTGRLTRGLNPRV